MEQPSKGKDIAIGILCFLVGALLSYVIFTLIGRNATPTAAPTIDQSQLGTGAQQVESDDFTITQDPTNPDQNVFTATKLGLSFSYLKYSYSYDENNPGINRAVLVNSPKISGNTISFGPTYSSYVTLYPKQIGQGLETSIQSQFLQSIPSTSCITSRVQAGSDEAVYAPSSTISYVRLHTIAPNGCPSQFDFSNASATFFALSNQPAAFFYVIGESDGSMPLLTSNGAPFWTTMKFSSQ